ncbi:uncharacterized protein FFB20_14159 [Fusarium fujikuroi]|uniref:Uncharacterized protein n=2 Tax=Fusarium fujikuroi TaxID=5127 RepID=S0DSN1_GIBF5|nr:uncharacterized protein FFUJ_02404 [Fusarium fujikuroi IMI 58289]KLP01878.1 uncharacterized protein Y057_8980 [Fusarium fujikuroi]QGI61614.1 hypothetical protein CEK27_005585 [Fusarium fujikuroi]QGI92513.1 hypothetical protein CEK26_005582 [Fusarium fujikuroi]CCT65461.1 uncharacterized protein FFUJ_02404 [Fusarium fujikuroi IMI 58289]SCO13118.1 uncharacterized protein FFB20_14159 [Fusarium fujikuroi]
MQNNGMQLRTIPTWDLHKILQVAITKRPGVGIGESTGQSRLRLAVAARRLEEEITLFNREKQPTPAEPTPAAEHDPDVEMPDEPAEPTAKPAPAPTEPTPEESSKPASNPTPTPADIDIELTDDDESPDDDEIPEGQFLTPPAIVLPLGLGTTNTIDAKA